MSIVAELKYTANLDKGVCMTPITPSFMGGDQEAHRVTVDCYRQNSREPVDLYGAGVTAYFVRADGMTIPLVGETKGSKASVLLPAACYAVMGRFSLVIKLSLDDGTADSISTVFWGEGAVSRSRTDVVIDPDSVIPSLEELLAQIAAMEIATNNANQAANNANQAATDALKNVDEAVARQDETISQLSEEIGEKVDKTNFDAFVHGADVMPKSSTVLDKNGITVTPSDDGYILNGQATSGVYYVFYDEKTELPYGVVPNQKYLLKFNIYATFDVMAYNGTDWTYLVSAPNASEFTVPTDAVGLQIRVYLNIYKLYENEHLVVELYAAESLKTLSESIDAVEAHVDSVEEAVDEINDDINVFVHGIDVMPKTNSVLDANGITITPSDEGYVLNGKATTGTYYYFYDNQNKLPHGIKPGFEYRIKFNKYMNFNVIFHNGSGWETVFNAPNTGVFTVPKDAVGMRIRVYVNIYTTYINDLLTVEMYSTDSSRYPVNLIEEHEYENRIIPPAPMITIIDDDGSKKFTTLLLPIIQEKRVPIASAVPIKEIETLPDNTMSWEQIENCALNGAEILSHTYSNISREGGANLNTREISYDYRLAQYHLRNHGIKSEGLVFVGDSSNEAKFVNACKQVYQYGFKAGTNKRNIKGAIDPYGINRWAVNTDMTLSEITELIDTLIANGTGWDVWMIHTSYIEFQQAQADIIASAIDYAIEKGVAIVTVEYGAREYLGIT